MPDRNLQQMWEAERDDTAPEQPEQRPALPNGMVNLLNPQTGDPWVLELRDWYRLTGCSLLTGFGDTGSFTGSMYRSTAAEWLAGTRTKLYAGSDPVSSGPRTVLTITSWAPLLLNPGDVLSGNVEAVTPPLTLAGLAFWLKRLAVRRS